ncbi:unnamed protein product, partial [Adineta steineri]
MTGNTSNFDRVLLSKFKYGILLENILQYNLDFSNDGFVKYQIVADYVNYLAEKRYISNYEHLNSSKKVLPE